MRVRSASGRAAPLVLASLASLLLLAALGLWFLPRARNDTREARSPAPAPELVSSAATPAAPPLAHARAPAEPVPVPLDRPAARARLVVRVLAPAGGLPDGPIRVTLTRADGTEEPGFELTRAAPLRELELAPGELTVAAEAAGPPALSSAPTHTSVRAGTSAYVELELAASVRFRGIVRDESDVVREQIEVALARGGKIRARAQSDAAGRFALAPLPAGEYELVVGDPRGPLVPRATLVLTATDGPREIVLPTPVPLALRIVDAEGLPVEGARIEGTGKPGGYLSGVTDADGRLRVEQLPPGEYRVFARHDAKGRGNRALALDGDSSVGVFEIVLYR